MTKRLIRPEERRRKHEKDRRLDMLVGRLNQFLLCTFFLILCIIACEVVTGWLVVISGG